MEKIVLMKGISFVDVTAHAHTLAHMHTHTSPHPQMAKYLLSVLLTFSRQNSKLYSKKSEDSYSTICTEKLS